MDDISPEEKARRQVEAEHRVAEVRGIPGLQGMESDFQATLETAKALVIADPEALEMLDLIRA